MMETEIVVVKRMEKYGGSFVQALAQCFYRADPQNFLKLRKTFSDYWDQYENLPIENIGPITTSSSFNGRGSNIPEGFDDNGFVK